MRARTSLTALVALVALALPAIASASSVTVGGSAVLNLSANVTSFGQSFTVPAGTDGFLHTLRLNYRPATSHPTFRVSVSAIGSGGLPTGTPLYTSAPISSPETVSVPTTVYPNVTVTPGTQYAFFVDNATSGQLLGNLGNVYNGGRQLVVVGGAWALGPTSDLNFRADFSTGQRASTTTLACTDASVVVSAETTCTATVADAGGGAAPTGTVSFSDTMSAELTPLSCTLIGGTCTVTLQPLVVGEHAVSASYTGTTHLASSGGTTVTATARPTSTAVDCAPAVLPVDAPATCTVTVTDTGSGGLTPTGVVSFASSSSGGFTPETCTLSDTGTCSVSYVPTAVDTGTHTITGTYGGAASFSPGSSAHTVTVSTRATETTTACTPAVQPVGEATTCTVHVADVADGSASVPGGTVTFDHTGDGALSAASCTLSAGSCGVTYTGAAAGVHTVTGDYAGGATFAPSGDGDAVTVRLRATATSVACAPDAVTAGSLATCTVTVADVDTGTTSAPGGAVAIAHTGDGDLSAPSCMLSDGTCRVAYTPSAPGTGEHEVTAGYDGDALHAAGAANATIAVVAPFPVPRPQPEPIPLPAPTPAPTPQPAPPLPPSPGPPPTRPTTTRLTSDVACFGTGPRARGDITVRYSMSEAATTTFKLQRRTSPSVAAPTRCPAGLPAEHRAITKDGDRVFYATAFAWGATTSARTVPLRRLVITRTEAAGAHSMKLLRAFDVATLRPGAYRLRIAPVAASGVEGPVTTLSFWVPAATRATQAH